MSARLSMFGKEFFRIHIKLKLLFEKLTLMSAYKVCHEALKLTETSIRKFDFLDYNFACVLRDFFS
jgi:hypothetical protein